LRSSCRLGASARCQYEFCTPLPFKCQRLDAWETQILTRKKNKEGEERAAFARNRWFYAGTAGVQRESGVWAVSVGQGSNRTCTHRWFPRFSCATRTDANTLRRKSLEEDLEKWTQRRYGTGMIKIKGQENISSPVRSASGRSRSQSINHNVNTQLTKSTPPVANGGMSAERAWRLLGALVNRRARQRDVHPITARLQCTCNLLKKSRQHPRDPTASTGVWSAVVHCRLSTHPCLFCVSATIVACGGSGNSSVVKDRIALKSQASAA
jgi:hypothetical protein